MADNMSNSRISASQIQQQPGNFQQFMMALGSQSPSTRGATSNDRASSKKLVKSQLEKASILQTLVRANQIMRNQSSELNSVQRMTPLPSFNNGRLVTNLPSKRSEIDGDISEQRTLNNNMSMQLEPKFKSPISGIVISKGKSIESLKHAKSTEQLAPPSDAMRSEQTRLTSIAEAHFGSMPQLKPNLQNSVKQTKKSVDQTSAVKVANMNAMSQEYNTLDLAQYLKVGERKDSGAAKEQPQGSARYFALKASEKQALKMQNQIRKSMMDAQRHDQRKVAPYSQTASLRDEYAGLAAKLRNGPLETPDRAQPGHLSKISLHLRHVKDYNSVLSHKEMPSARKLAQNTHGTSLLESRRAVDRMVRGAISDSIDTDTLRHDYSTQKPRRKAHLLDMSASVDRADGGRVDVDSLLTAKRSGSNLVRGGFKLGVHVVEGLVDHRDSLLMQDSIQDSTLTGIESTNRSALKDNSMQIMKRQMETNLGAKSMTSMPKAAIDQEELFVEKLKFKLKQRDSALEKQVKAYEIQNAKMIGRMGGGTNKFDTGALPKAMKASTLLKSGKQNKQESSIDSSLEKRRLYEKKRTFRDFERMETQDNLNKSMSPRHQSIEKLHNNSISSLVHVDVSESKRGSHIQGVADELDAVAPNMTSLQQSTLVASSVDDVDKFVDSPRRGLAGAPTGMANIYKKAYIIEGKSPDSMRLKHHERRQEHGIMHPKRVQREQGQTFASLGDSPAGRRDNSGNLRSKDSLLSGQVVIPAAQHTTLDLSKRKQSLATSSQIKSWAVDSVHQALAAPPSNEDDRIIGSPILDVKKLAKHAGFDKDYKAKLIKVAGQVNHENDMRLIKRLEMGDHKALDEIVPRDEASFNDGISLFSKDNIIMYKETDFQKKKRELNKISISKRRERTQQQLSNERQRQMWEMQKMREAFSKKQDKDRQQAKEDLIKEYDPRAIKQHSPEKEASKKRKAKKKLQERYTIKSKDWVLNPPPPTLPSTTSVDLSAEELRTSRHGSSPFRDHSSGATKKMGRVGTKRIQRKGLVQPKHFAAMKAEGRELRKQASTESYLRQKEYELELKRDKQYKKTLNIFARKKLRQRSARGSSSEYDSSDDYSSEYGSSQDEISVSVPEQQTSQHPSTVSLATLMVGRSTGVEFENLHGQFEALEYNGGTLPDEFLLAKLAFHEDPIDFWVNHREVREKKELDRRNTDYHFDQADMYHSSQGSFNQMFESEMPYQEVSEGLDKVMQELRQKSEYLKEVKYTNRNINHKLEGAKNVYRKFAERSLNKANVPIPVLLKIKNGILSLPAAYTVTEGVAFAMRSSLEAMQGMEHQELEKVILNRNNINDNSLATILKGLCTRGEFCSLITQGNEIGIKSAKTLCQMLAHEPLDPKDLPALLAAASQEEQGANADLPDAMEPPADGEAQMEAEEEESESEPDQQQENHCAHAHVDELRIRHTKVDPKALDFIITQLYAPGCYLRRLALSDLWMSERQQKTLLGSLKETQLLELDLSWTKMQAPALGLLFCALEENRTMQNLNLGWIQMGGSHAHTEVLEKHFAKFCSFLKESMKLIHLNLTSINLEEKYMLELICNIKRSRSLHCVHMCGNRFTPASVDMLNLKLKPTAINSMAMKEGKTRKKQRLVAKLQEVIAGRYRERYEKIYDSVHTKEVMLEWLSVRQPYHHSALEDQNFLPLILSKQLGHGEIKNAKHWKINNECYQCDRWKHTVIFWDLKHKGQQFQISDPLLEEMIDDMIATSNERFEQLKSQSKLLDGAKAYLAGTFTDWQPRRMMLIDEFLALLQKKEELVGDRDRRQAFAQSIENSWRNILRQNLPYKGDHTQMIDMPESYHYTPSNPPKLDRNQLFVYCDFIKPGKHQYIVSYENDIVQPKPEFPAEPQKPGRWSSLTSSINSSISGSKKSTGRKLTKEQQKILDDFVPIVSKVKLTSYHEFVGQALLANYNINTKENKFDAVERTFDRSKSVFKEWKIDRPKAIEQGLLEEIEYWNVANFVKDENEVQEIIEVMKQHAVFLKTMFTIRSAASAYPAIRWLSYAPMIADLDIFDNNFDMGAVDRVFIAVTSNLALSQSLNIPGKDMSRFQFYESIVRVAMIKYKGSATETVVEGLRKLFSEVLLPTVDLSVWAGVRENQIWTLEMDDLYKANLPAMQKLYRYYFATKKRKTYTLEDAVDMFGSAVQLDLLPEQITFAWGLAKQTVNNDLKQRNQYYTSTFAEFLEFFARVANQKFKEGPKAMDPLVEKVERLMDLVFPLIGMKRKEVNIEDEYVSVSEEELDEDRYFI